MIEIIDNIIIFFISLLFFLSGHSISEEIVWILIVLSITCLLNIFRGKKIAIPILLIYLIISIFYNNRLLLFIPFVQYNILDSNNNLKTILLSVINIFALLIMQVENNIYILLLFFVNSFEYYKTRKILSLKKAYINLVDSSKEDIIELKNEFDKLKDFENNKLELAKSEERNHIARDIHDNVGHILSRSIIQIGAIKTINTNNALTKMLEELSSSLVLAMDNIRNSIHRIYLESANIEDEIQGIISEFPKYKINFEHSEDLSKLDSKIKSTMLVILKEALNNIVKHSNANKIDIVIKEYNTFIKFVIHDNGTTFKEVAIPDGIGLKNIKSRIKDLNGHVNIFTDDGFKIFINIPK